jgi:membrane-associated phospholipid phosphatase
VVHDSEENRLSGPEVKVKAKSSAAILIILFVTALFLILFLSQRVFFVPKILILCLSLLVAAAVGRLTDFLRDWFLFIGFIYLFDSLRGSIFILTCQLDLPVYTLYVIKAEKFLFGAIPSVVLQDWFLRSPDPSGFTWFEKLITVAHGTHFVAFLIVGLIIWLYKASYFRFFKVSFYLVIFLGLLGYFAVPTVPPWMASNIFSLLPRLIRFNAVIFNMVIPDITSGFDTNPIAAMPSLHAAFPVLLGLILWRICRWKAFPFYLYVFLMLFAIVYTGDHYVADVLAGGLLAVLCYGAAFLLTKSDFAVKDPNSGKQGIQDKGHARLLRSLIGGGVILSVGIGIGSYNREQFVRYPMAYNLYAPRYVDFFKKEADFRSNFQVQFYLGSYHFLRKDIRTAIVYYERSLKAARSDEEKKRAEGGLEACRKVLGIQPEKSR